MRQNKMGGGVAAQCCRFARQRNGTACASFSIVRSKLWFSFQTLRSGWKKPAALPRSAMLLLQTAQTQRESHTTAMGSACSDDRATNSCAAANKKIKLNQIK